MEANLMKVAAERIAKARAELILSRTFYGVLVGQVIRSLRTDIPTMATNGKQHFYNPTFIAELSQEELLAVQAHESEHDARRHHTRRGGRDPVKWNIATDYGINIDLVDAGFKLPKDALIDPKYRGMSAEDIYRSREIDEELEKPQEARRRARGRRGRGGRATSRHRPDNDGDEREEPTRKARATRRRRRRRRQGKADEDGDERHRRRQGAAKAKATRRRRHGRRPGSADGDADGEPGRPSKSSGDPGRMGEVLDAADDVAELADEDAKWERVTRQAAMLAAKRGDAPGHVAREIERSDHPPQDWRETSAGLLRRRRDRFRNVEPAEPAA